MKIRSSFVTAGAFAARAAVALAAVGALQGCSSGSGADGTPGDGSTPGGGSAPVAAGFVVDGANLVTTEGGGTATFQISLTRAPTGNVGLWLEVDDRWETLIKVPGGSIPVSGDSLFFTTADWNVPKTVTVYGQDDGWVDGDQLVAISISVGGSVDPAYDQLSAVHVNVTNMDDDVASYRVNKTTISVTEGGTYGWLSVSLDLQPSATVTIPVTSLDPTEATVATTTNPPSSTGSISLTFTTANWATSQNVYILPQADGVVDGDQVFDLVIGAPTGATEYAALSALTVSVTNVDAD